MTISPVFPADLTELAKKAMLEYQFLPEFPITVEQEVNQIPSPVIPTSDSVQDLRDKLWFSIDHYDTRDIDQLTYAEPLSDGQVKLYIAIADVDSLVKKNSAIDHYAEHNATSIYTPTKTFFMLPEKLSTQFTSLNEREDRMAIVIEVIITPNGAIEQHRLYPAYVRNQAKLTYSHVTTWLDNQGSIPIRVSKIAGLEEQIKFQDKIAHQLKAYRVQQGALILDKIEPYVIFMNGQIVGLQVSERNRAWDLIENFMVIANTAAARFSRDHHLPLLRRVIRTPKRWDRLLEIAKKYGEILPEQPNAKALDLFLLKRRLIDPLHFAELSLIVIKLLGNGEYVAEHPEENPMEYFGLALRDYVHATAPNRRYSDLIIQRLLKAGLQNQSSPYLSQELEALAKHCTEKEDKATKVERKMRKSAAALLLSSKLNQTFDAIVTGASLEDRWVRIFDPPIEGKVIQGYENIDVGDRIQVKLVSVNVEQGFIDFILVN